MPVRIEVPGFCENLAAAPAYKSCTAAVLSRPD